MSFQGHAHRGKDKVRRTVLAALGAALVVSLGAGPAAASHNSGTGQYQPSAPPGQDGGGGGGGTAAPAPAPAPAPEAEPLPPLPEAVDPAAVPTDDPGITVPGPAAGDDALPSAAPRSSGEDDDALELADAEPLSVAALRPRAAIGAQASSDELGIIAPAAGIVLLLLGAAVLLRRGRARTAGAS